MSEIIQGVPAPAKPNAHPAGIPISVVALVGQQGAVLEVRNLDGTLVEGCRIALEPGVAVAVLPEQVAAQLRLMMGAAVQNVPKV